jgi:hypothetical protein
MAIAHDIFGQRYFRTSTPVGGEFKVNTYNTGISIATR